MGVEDALRPVGSCRDSFALMLHDRMVELEAKVARLEPAPLDPGLRLLGAAGASASGAVFVRAQSSSHASPAEVLESALRRLGPAGGGRRWEAWACEHWSCLLAVRPYVVELVLQRVGPCCADVAAVGHAVLDAVREASGGQDATAEACALHSPAWFVESVRAAGACARAWSAAAREVVAEESSDGEGADAEEEPRRRAWSRLHGWLAAQVECTDVWHPRAPSAAVLAAGLEAAMAAL